MRRLDRILLFLTTALGVLPLVIGLFKGVAGRSLFYFCAPDTFYYLTVARNVAHTGRPTFDGEHLTNGYHPLWQAITSVLAVFTRLFVAGDFWLVGLTIVLGVALVGLTTALLCEVIRLEFGGLTPVTFLIPLGALSLVQVPLMIYIWGSAGRAATTVWGAANGMETSLVLAAYALCALAYVRLPRTQRGGVLLGICLGLISLARLDHAIFAVCICAGLFLFEPAARRFAGVAGAVLLSVLIAYTTINRLWFGMALPVSGAIKSTFPHFTNRNLKLAVGLLSHPRKVPMTHAHRALQMLLPAGVALLTLLVVAGRKVARALNTPPSVLPRTRIDDFLLSTAVGAIGLFLYDFAFVPPMNQGFWYFPVSNLFVSLVVVVWVSRRFTAAWTRLPLWAIAVALAAGCVVVVDGFYKIVNPKEDSRTAWFFFDEAPGIREFYKGKNVRMTEYDDGIVTFATGIPAMSGMGLTLDVDAIDAAGGVGLNRHDSSLLELGIARGYDRFTTWMYPHGRVNEKSSTLDIRRAYLDYIGLEAHRCRLRIEYRSPKSDFAIAAADCKKAK
jgi:hypothetical protein